MSIPPDQPSLSSVPPAASNSQTHVVIGGGIVGLSIAYELAKRGQLVVVLERDQFAMQSSWAGAGIIPAENPETAIHPLEHLESLSHDLHKQWANELLTQTGIDNGFRKCGGLHLARTTGELAAIAGLKSDWTERNIPFETLDAEQTKERFPFLSPTIHQAAWVPGESQFTNPRHNEALISACQQLGVQLHENLGDVKLILDESSGEILHASADQQTFAANNFFVTAGPWSEQITQPLEVPLPMQPVRGQIAMYQVPPDVVSTADWPIINEGSRYLVPRCDGHIIAGATIEEVGFDCQTTDAEVAHLRQWAEGISNHLNDSTYVKAWAGLRPGTYDGFPYLGQIGRFRNVFVATGHFKAGLHLSTGTAVVMADLALGKNPTVDLRPFSPQRIASLQTPS
jgi:glycine oxidase